MLNETFKVELQKLILKVTEKNSTIQHLAELTLLYDFTDELAALWPGIAVTVQEALIAGDLKSAIIPMDDIKLSLEVDEVHTVKFVTGVKAVAKRIDPKDEDDYPSATLALTLSFKWCDEDLIFFAHRLGEEHDVLLQRMQMGLDEAGAKKVSDGTEISFLPQ